MKWIVGCILAFISWIMNVHAEGIVSAESLQKVRCSVGERQLSVSVKKCFFGASDHVNTKEMEKTEKGSSYRKDISDAHVSVALDFRLIGKYSFIVTRKDAREEVVLGEYPYENRSGTIPDFGPYTALLWDEREKVIYWIVIPHRERLREAGILVFKLDPLNQMGMPYQEYVKNPAPLMSLNKPISKYAFRNLPGQVDYIPLWMWIDHIAFNFDITKNVINIGLIDNGPDGGTLTISYDISRGTWGRSFAPSQMRLLREASREKDKQRLRQDGMGEIHKGDESGR